MNVLCVNTYGGSLLLGATAAKAAIVATLEDVGFGSDLQALNFPKVPRYERRADWPEKFSTSWRAIDVIAHPPCAAFSAQNTSANRRGTNTDAFHCHQDVMDYSLGHRCRSLAIESVMGAYEGAHESYEEAALKHGYRVNYVMVNSASLGVPQWRERIWIIFHQVPKRQAFKIDLRPKYTTLRSVLNPSGTHFEFGGSPRRVWDKIRSSVTAKWPSGAICAVLEKVYDIPREPNFKGTRDKFGITGFTTSHVRFIGPNDFASVVLYDQLLAYGKRILTVEEYCSIMGFPRDYKWGKRVKQFRAYLSKGVCPPVAAWVLKMVDKNATGWTGPATHEEIDFGGVIDLRIKKADALTEARRAAR
jgi:site-specific DNA-cytosine methylase